MKSRLFYISILLSLFFNGFSQLENLFDTRTSLQYVQLLIHQQKYFLAADEYARLYKLDPAADSLLEKSMYYYRLSHRSYRAVELFNSFNFQSDSLKTSIILEYSKNMLLKGSIDTASSFINNSNSITDSIKCKWNISSRILKQEYSHLDSIATSNKTPISLCIPDSLYNSVVSRHYKSPLAAAGLSLIVPGLGKIYTGNYKDGIVVFYLIASNAFVAYRGFQKHGKNSIFGWGFATIGGCFYLGNIFGSIRAAHAYNSKQHKHLYDKTIQYLMYLY